MATLEAVDNDPFSPIPLAQTSGRTDAPWQPDRIAPPPKYQTSMADNPISRGIGEAILSPISEAGEYVGGLMQGTIPFEPGEAVKEGLKLGSAFIGPKIGGGSAAAGAAKLAPMLSMFAGPMAETADRGALKLAQEMAKKGMDRRQIWDATGWFTGADNKWRFEIPDHGLKVRAGEGQGFTNPENAIRHPAVEEAYSQFDNLTHDVNIDYKKPVEGKYSWPNVQNPEGNISLNAATPSEARIVAAHEIQHPIQRVEEFATGMHPRKLQGDARAELTARGIDPDANPNLVAETAFDIYRRHAGEVEARNVERRLHMSPETRKFFPPWETEDVPRDQQIVKIFKLKPINHDPFAK